MSMGRTWGKSNTLHGPEGNHHLSVIFWGQILTGQRSWQIDTAVKCQLPFAMQFGNGTSSKNRTLLTNYKRLLSSVNPHVGIKVAFL